MKTKFIEYTDAREPGPIFRAVRKDENTWNIYINDQDCFGNEYFKFDSSILNSDLSELLNSGNYFRKGIHYE